jgi:aspartate/tyrosine/aromatic aminotransferase
MFTFTGLSAEQVQFMQEKYHVYMPSTGRISVAGITEPRIPHLAKAINEAVLKFGNANPSL